MTVNIRYIIKTGIALQNEIKRFLSDADGPEEHLIVESVVEAIAEAADMVAVTRDDLPKDFKEE